MISVPIFEVKNKLTQFIHMVENDETDGIEITRHGKSVAIIGKKAEFKSTQIQDPFLIAYKNFRNKLEKQDEFTESEWKEYFDIPRQKSNLRHPEDFE